MQVRGVHGILCVLGVCVRVCVGGVCMCGAHVLGCMGVYMCVCWGYMYVYAGGMCMLVCMCVTLKHDEERKKEQYHLGKDMSTYTVQ